MRQKANAYFFTWTQVREIPQRSVRVTKITNIYETYIFLLPTLKFLRVI